MIIKKPGYYWTRSGEMAQVVKIEKETIWPVKGFVNNKEISWTRFGAESNRYNKDQKENLNYYTDFDLIKEVTPEKNPEYFL